MVNRGGVSGAKGDHYNVAMSHSHVTTVCFLTSLYMCYTSRETKPKWQFVEKRVHNIGCSAARQHLFHGSENLSSTLFDTGFFFRFRCVVLILNKHGTVVSGNVAYERAITPNSSCTNSIHKLEPAADEIPCLLLYSSFSLSDRAYCRAQLQMLRSFMMGEVGRGHP